MDIGEQQRVIIVEPIEMPQTEPNERPVEPAEEPVPAREGA